MNKDKENNKKSSSLSLWLMAAGAFLVLMIGVISWISTRNTPSSEKVSSRSTTLTDAGFDTPITFTATGTEEQYVQWLETVKKIFTEDNALFDQYHPYEGVNNVYVLNEEAADHAVEVDQKLIDVIELSNQAHAINPEFDIAEGKLLSLWHDIREADQPVLPSQEQIDQAKQHTGMEGILIDGQSVSFTDESIQLDLGAVAKGYTAGRAAKAIEEMGCESGFINAGGNVVLIGEKTNGKPWNIGIQEPDSSDSLVQFITQTPLCLVTSGDYQRYVTIDGTRYSHIIDPETGYPAAFMRSVTVIDEDSAWADAISTALFAMPLEQSMQTADDLGLQAIWIVDEGSGPVSPDLTSDGFDIYYTDGIKDQVKLTKASQTETTQE